MATIYCPFSYVDGCTVLPSVGLGAYFRAHENNLPLFLALLIDCRDDSELFLAVVKLSDTVGLLRWYGVRLTTTVVARRRQKHSTSNFNSNFYLTPWLQHSTSS
eukprot:scaffold1478_cov213-Alexandrium_tamarense.AAC.8